MRINKIDPGIREYLYYRFNERQGAAGISDESTEMKEFSDDFNANFDLKTSDFKINYYKYAPNIQKCLDEARKITEDHWHIKIEWQ